MSSGAALRVVMSCSRRAGLLPQYEKQLADAGIDFLVLQIEQPPNNGLGSMASKLHVLRKVVEFAGGVQKLVFSDAWDVLFYGSAEEVTAKIPWSGVLMAAERNCWPDTYLAEHFPGSTPWRYVNGGLLAGTPESILIWCDQVEKHHAYIPQMVDQQWFNHRKLQGDPLIVTDEQARLFYCMIHDAAELGFDNGIPVNRLNNERPNFIHFNGKTDPTMFFLRQSLSKGLR